MKPKSGARGNRKKAEKSENAPQLGPASDISIVAIGASAGGIEALTDLMTQLPADTGVAFVLVQHLDPTQHSFLTEMLSRKTAMTVEEVWNRVRAMANHVYVIPSNATTSISGHTRHLSPREESRGLHLPVDLFARALAEQKSNRSIGVTLSSSSSDGAMGMAVPSWEGRSLSWGEPTAECPSPRERQVLHLLADGKTNKEIGAVLDISKRTVESYRARIMTKLKLHSTAELVRYAVRNHIVEA